MGQEGSKLESGEQEAEQNGLHAQPSAAPSIAGSTGSQKSTGGASSVSSAKTQWMRPHQHKASGSVEVRRKGAVPTAKQATSSGGSSPPNEELAGSPTGQTTVEQDYRQRLEKSKKELVKKLAIQIKSVQTKWVS
jgi:hypothetical protein